MTRKFLIVIFCLFPSTVFAESVVKGMNGYNKIVVDFSKNADQCELEGASAYVAHLRENLAGIGIDEKQDSNVRLRLKLGGTPLGLMDGQCAVAANLSVETVLEGKNVKARDRQVQMAIDRAGSFEVTLFNTGAFAVTSQVYKHIDGKSKSLVQWKLREIIKRLTEKLDVARQT